MWKDKATRVRYGRQREPEFFFPPEVRERETLRTLEVDKESRESREVVLACFNNVELSTAEELLPPELWFLILRLCNVRDLMCAEKVGHHS